MSRQIKIEFSDSFVHELQSAKSLFHHLGDQEVKRILGISTGGFH